MLKVGQFLNHLKSTTALFLIESRDVDARHHFIFVGVFVVNEENLAITLAKVQRDHKVGVVLRVGRRLAHAQLLLTVVRA